MHKFNSCVKSGAGGGRLTGPAIIAQDKLPKKNVQWYVLLPNLLMARDCRSLRPCWWLDVHLFFHRRILIEMMQPNWEPWCMCNKFLKVVTLISWMIKKWQSQEYDLTSSIPIYRDEEKNEGIDSSFSLPSSQSIIFLWVSLIMFPRMCSMKTKHYLTALLCFSLDFLLIWIDEDRRGKKNSSEKNHDKEAAVIVYRK